MRKASTTAKPHAKAKQIAALYAEGYGMKAIGKQLGIGENTARRSLRTSGVKLRTDREGKGASPVAAHKIRKQEAAPDKWIKSAMACARKRWPLTDEQRRARARDRGKTPEAREKSRASALARYHGDEQVRQRDIWRSRLIKALTMGRDTPAQQMGCANAQELVEWIESKWEDGMNWDNYGRIEVGVRRWNVDHIFPVTAFDLTDSDQAAACWHYLNLQPMWALENIQKGGKV